MAIDDVSQSLYRGKRPGHQRSTRTDDSNWHGSLCAKCVSAGDSGASGEYKLSKIYDRKWSGCQLPRPGAFARSVTKIGSRSAAVLDSEFKLLFTHRRLSRIGA